ncbi:MAG: putative selenate reductase subunit YgfK [Candidatus Marinimicrobia bacterium]|nr:putative selenate reductase subunit YgfK [Candidatus Neomarinimicrobiota bacterium]
MSDKLHPVSIQHLISWMLAEFRTDHLFGIHRDLFFVPKPSDPFQMMRYGQVLETPIGVAAGPHTQLSQNIIAAWLCGARYMELKTVQTLDELEISKPCIDMQDEGYNCEWSQELKLEQSLDEYLNAWIGIHVLKDHFGWESSQDPGVIFNMSVGYNLAGMMQPNVQHFMDRMENSQELLDQKLDLLTSVYPGIKDLNIPPRMTDNVTLSTMHGCPPDEIGRIAAYLINERKLHTAVKLNPTLLGAADLRQILNHDLGYDSVHVPDEAFDHDLKYPDALNLINSLTKQAQTVGVEFGLKLTNTLEVENHRPVFAAQENMMYLSGRALHPISINLAAKLQNEFKGKLDISFSAGADAFNISDTLACNMRPITTCTDVLKPGGYSRLGQYLSNLSTSMNDTSATSLDEFIVNQAQSGEDTLNSGLGNLMQYASAVIQNPRYHKHNHHFDSIKTHRTLNTFDCISAPCIDACAADQNIPEYLYHTSQGDFKSAFAAIQDTNPLPGVTGHVCDHLCQLKCTRNNYDSPLLIREIKRFVTEREIGNKPVETGNSSSHSAAIIGAGPAGLSCAYFLARAGVTVEVFESKFFVGGMVSDAIPEFRLLGETIDLDISVLRELGVRFHFGRSVSTELFTELKSTHDNIFVGVGAQISLKLGISGENLSGILDPLKFLSAVRQGDRPELGSNVAIIGGGNTAMDAARTALRLSEGKGAVNIIYRRTRSEMPADIDEIEAALAEGITFHELITPLSFTGTDRVIHIHCQKMVLGEPDASGRRRPVPLEGETFDIPVDTVIPAIGQALNVDFIDDKALTVNPETCMTQIPGVYAGGDAVRGASSVINAIGDGQIAARQILKGMGEKGSLLENKPRVLSIAEIQKKAAIREYGIEPPHEHTELTSDFPLVHRTLTEEEAVHEASRCLLCDDFCSVCVGVCPNLANLTYYANPETYPVQEASYSDEELQIKDAGLFRVDQEPQVLNIGDFCNECGNCTTFCPTAGDPYKDKPRIHLSEKSFEEADSGYHFKGKSLIYKHNDYHALLSHHDGEYLFLAPDVRLLLNDKTKLIKDLHFEIKPGIFNTREALEMIVLFESLIDNPIINQGLPY